MRRKDRRARVIARQRQTRIRNSPRKIKERARKAAKQKAAATRA